MAIIVFLIDNTGSMNQRTFLNGRPRLLDVARGVIDNFMRARAKAQENRVDRYMLMTFEDPPYHIKAGWKESISTFSNELKNLQCCAMANVGLCVRRVFELLNVNRMQTGIDTYAQGRNPFFLEPATVILITDGSKPSNNNINEISFLTQPTYQGLELTKDAFRWDQRLFSFVLRLSSAPSERETGVVPCDNSVIETMCEITGGRSYSITSHRALTQSIDNLVQKIQNGVVINFEKFGPDPPPIHHSSAHNEGHNFSETEGSNHLDGRGNNPNHAKNNSPPAWHSCRKLIYVRKDPPKSCAFWPIPESYWPDPALNVLPQRSAHPNVKFSCISHVAMVIDNMPFDKYELEPSPLTQYILSRKQPGVCWQCFVPNSNKNPDVMYPFGYLKASNNLTCVNLFVMPFNYPMLFPVLEEIIKVYRQQKLTADEKQQFQNYLRTMPVYYAAPLRKAMEKMGINKAFCNNLLPDHLDSWYNFQVSNYLKKMKQHGKQEFDRICNEITSRQNSNGLYQETVQVYPRISMPKELLTHPSLQGIFSKDTLDEYHGFLVAVTHKHRHTTSCGGNSYRNVYDIQRKELLQQLFRMRLNFLERNLDITKLIEQDLAHLVPISQMGNYQDYLKRFSPQLREVEPNQMRQHLFGNPFKSEKRMVVDEADQEVQKSKRSSEAIMSSSKYPLKRKPGPLPRNYVFKRKVPRYPYSSRPSLLPSPAPSSLPSSSSLSYSFPCSTTVSINSLSTPNINGSRIITTNNDMDDDEDEDDDIPVLTIEDRPRSPSPPPLDKLPPASSTDNNRFNNSSDLEDFPPPSLLPISEFGANSNEANNLPPALEMCSSSNGGPPPVVNGIPPSPKNNNDSDNTNFFNNIKINNSSSSSNNNNSNNNNNTSNNNNNNNNNNNINTNNINDDSNCNSNNSNSDSRNNRRTIFSNNNSIVNSLSSAISTKTIETKKKLTNQEIDTVRKHNLHVRGLIYREIRKFGKQYNYNKIFEYIGTLKGPMNMKERIVKDATGEALRFKRKDLVIKLESHLKTCEVNDEYDSDGFN